MTGSGPAGAGSAARGGPVRHHASLVLFLVAAFVPAIFGAQFTPGGGGGGWYAQLAKPAWTPPGWLFGPVWTVLYTMIGLSGWVAWKRGVKLLEPAMVTYGAQLILNGLWSWLFFGLQRPGAALIEILVLWLAIAATIVLFRRRSIGAALLLFPYLAWVFFASMLNAAIWMLNG